jgi:2'-5' RNA ligase
VRLFVALAPPESVLDHLDAACAPLRPERSDLRWTSREAWHVTLAFLGDVSDRSLARLEPRLERGARRHAAFGLSLEGAGAFPGPQRARVVWGGVSGDRKALGDLAATVTAGARRAGALPPDAGRKYHPHLTLARSREATDVRPLVESLSGFRSAPWKAGEILLIRSRLQGNPRYETLGSWPLSSG